MYQTDAYKKLSYVTVQDLYDAMQYKPVHNSDQPTLAPELSRIIAFIENTYFDMENDSPEYVNMEPQASQSSQQETEVQNKLFQTLVLV